MGNGLNSSVAGVVGSGVGGVNNGNSTTTQQVATGRGLNQDNTASVNGSGITAIDQDTTTVNFNQLW
ncbi:hypothetical protein NKH77_26095 [Streptomyces sp. M19]